jgi:hypothetical protein
VGLYVCGPTVYGDPHLGHARPAITFDILFRYLSHLGYKVRYVRNITDVGHLENDADEGEDKIAQKARLEQLEPMEVVQYYTERYHTFMTALNVKSPSIEPRASGHIIEQLSIVEKILKEGFAYESNGSVYFDVERYNEEHQYGILSGRVLEDLLSTTRYGPAVSASRMRNCPIDHSARTWTRPLLDAQQHDHHQRSENGQITGQLHHPGGILHRQPCLARKSLRAHDHPLFHTTGALPKHGGLLKRCLNGSRKRHATPDGWHGPTGKNKTWPVHHLQC